MNKPPIVCHFTSVHPAGDTRIFVKECRSLARAGFQVVLVAANAESGVKDGVRIIGVHTSGGRLRRMIFGARAVFRAALSVDADIYHFHDPELLRFAGRLRRAGKTVVYDSHEDLPRQVAHKHYIPSWLKPLISGVAEFLEDRWTRKCHAVITATAHIRDRFARFHELAVDVCNYPSLEELPEPDFSRERGRVACYIGSITEVRGIREKVEMMNGADFRLLLGGPFSPRELLEEMKSRPGWANVQYEGPLNREQVVDMLGRSAVGLVTMHNSPNYAEALPVKMFEYMAAGIPVITNVIPLWKRIAEENGCGIAVDISDADAFRKAVKELLDDPGRMRAFGRAGRHAVESRYNWGVEEKKLIALYRRLAVQP
jgi:glycosyltransferase involved in cell wall biosynthesis